MDHGRPAGRPLRVALVGFGYWGPNYARVLNDLPGVELTVVCDRSAERLAHVRTRYPAMATSDDLAGVLEHVVGVDLVKAVIGRELVGQPLQIPLDIRPAIRVKIHRRQIEEPFGIVGTAHKALSRVSAADQKFRHQRQPGTQ